MVDLLSQSHRRVRGVNSLAAAGHGTSFKHANCRDRCASKPARPSSKCIRILTWVPAAPASVRSKRVRHGTIPSSLPRRLPVESAAPASARCLRTLARFRCWSGRYEPALVRASRLVDHGTTYFNDLRSFPILQPRAPAIAAHIDESKS